jgi:hypothetical protein
MNKRVITPFLVLAGLVVVLGLACGTSTPSSAPTNAPVKVQPPVAVDTNTPAPVLPTDTAVPEAPAFFTEEFNQDPSANWTLEFHGPNKSKSDQFSSDIANGKFHIEIGISDLYAYFFYDPYNYDNVRIDMEVENLGVNSQNISLICRADNDQWYEFSVGSDGMWYLYAYDNGNYDTLAMAGAGNLRQGHATNDYGMSCIGDEIHMYVNGQELLYSPFKVKNYFFYKGQVGFNISSIKSTPVIVNVNWLKINQP